MIVYTEDGSPTILSSHYGEHYHSIHGARAESEHIFIRCGLLHRLGTWERTEELHLFEVGFGTGLNTLLTLREQQTSHLKLRYSTIEKYPLGEEVYNHLHFSVDLPEEDTLLQALHRAPWGEDKVLQAGFTLHKYADDLTAFAFPPDIDLIYFDAFSPDTQPDLWSEDVFARLAASCRPGAVLVTYCAKGEVRRRLARTGFRMKRLAGPPGKREILRATYSPLV